MLVIGNEALALHGLFTNRQRLDIDLIGSFDEVQNHIRKYSKDHKLIEARPFANGNKYVAKFADGKIFEDEIAWEDSTAEWLHQIAEADGRSFRDDGILGIPLFVPSIDLLYMLKLSHRYLKDSPLFLKTMDDIHLLRNFGAKFNDGYKNWFKKREEETYWYKHPRLMEMKKDNFFAASIVLLGNPATVARASNVGLAKASLYTRAAVENRVESFMRQGQEALVLAGAWVGNQAEKGWQGVRGLFRREPTN